MSAKTMNVLIVVGIVGVVAWGLWYMKKQNDTTAAAKPAATTAAATTTTS